MIGEQNSMITVNQEQPGDFNSCGTLLISLAVPISLFWLHWPLINSS